MKFIADALGGKGQPRDVFRNYFLNNFFDDQIKNQDSELHIYEEKIHHLADQMIRIDLDDGVKNNYEIFNDVIAKIK